MLQDRKYLTAPKLVKNIETCLEEDDYDPVELPEQEKMLTAYLERPKRKNDPRKKIKPATCPRR